MQILSDFDLLPATKLWLGKKNKTMHTEAIEKIWFYFNKLLLRN